MATIMSGNEESRFDTGRENYSQHLLQPSIDRVVVPQTTDDFPEEPLVIDSLENRNAFSLNMR